RCIGLKKADALLHGEALPKDAGWIDLACVRALRCEQPMGFWRLAECFGFSAQIVEEDEIVRENDDLTGDGFSCQAHSDFAAAFAVQRGYWIVNHDRSVTLCHCHLGQ